MPEGGRLIGRLKTLLKVTVEMQNALTPGGRTYTGAVSGRQTAPLPLPVTAWHNQPKSYFNDGQNKGLAHPGQNRLAVRNQVTLIKCGEMCGGGQGSLNGTGRVSGENWKISVGEL